MTRPPNTLATWAGAIATALKDYGFNSAEVYNQAELAIEQTRDPNARYPVTEMTRLWQTCVMVTEDPSFGLKVPQHLMTTVLT